VLIGSSASEVVERLLRAADDVAGDEGSALRRAIFGVFQRALPLQDGPGRVPVRRELREDYAEIDLTVSQRTEAPGAVDPRLIARINPLAAVRIELGILHVESFDPLVIDVDEGEVVEGHQQEVRRIVVDGAAGMTVECVQEHLERCAIEDVLAGMDLEGDVAAILVEYVED